MFGPFFLDRCKSWFVKQNFYLSTCFESVDLCAPHIFFIRLFLIITFSFFKKNKNRGMTQTSRHGGMFEPPGGMFEPMLIIVKNSHCIRHYVCRFYLEFEYIISGPNTETSNSCSFLERCGGSVNICIPLASKPLHVIWS